ncbi:MAG: FG-GAP-like repeat-containing protein [Marmoricola sp.]
MRFSRARYVAVCQQLLVAASVTAVALSATGVMTLDIVAPDAGGPTGGRAGAARPGHDLSSATHPGQGYVAARPVAPTVREVSIGARAEQPAPRPRGDIRSSARTAPNRAARQPPATVAGLPVAVLSPPEDVTGYATAGVTWSPGVRLSADQIVVQVRTRTDGTWSRWQRVAYHDDHAPDPGSAEAARTRPGTDAIVVGDVDQVQMRAATASGKPPAGIRLALIDPGRDHLVKQGPAIDTAKLPASDAHARGAPIENTGAEASSTPSSQGSLSLSGMRQAPKPKIYSRAQWGADESIREQSKPDYGTIETGFVHHTVNANDYTRRQVPALIRGIYAYHVESRGWRDIGYSFLVDRFGRIWEGRWGGVDRPVVGAHTYGYNDVSFAMSAIGNFDIYDHGRGLPPNVMLDAYAKLFAWKLSRYDIWANDDHVRVKSRWLQAINGHRDVGQTACPGRYLYAKLPVIRKRAYAIQKQAQQTGSPLQPPLAAKPQPAGMRFPSSSSVAGSHWPDVVMTGSGGGLSVLYTSGVMDYRAPVVSHGWAGRTQLVAAGDVTGDGAGDLLARTPGHAGWQVFAGDGHGHVSATPYRATWLFRDMDQVFAVGDWNHDGHADLMTRGGGSHHALYLYPGRGGAGFAARRQVAPRWGRFARTVLAGDLNGDHRADLVARGTDGRLYQVFGTAHGLSTPLAGRQLTAYDALLGAGDLDGDGHGDYLVRRRADGRSLLYRSNGAKRFYHPMGPFWQLSGLHNPTVGDLGGSHRPDLVGVTGDGDLRVFENNGRHNTWRIRSGGWTVGRASAIYDVGDWNGDGHPDLVSRHGDQLRLNPGRSGGRYGAGVIMSRDWSHVTDLAAVGDVTGDGHPDMMGRVNGNVLIFRGNGRHGFWRPQLAPTTMRSYNQVGSPLWRPLRLPVSGAYSSDGSFVPLGGGITVAGAFDRSGNPPLSRYDWVIGAGDVNGDGYADLIARQTSDHTLWMIPGRDRGFGYRMFLRSNLGRYHLGG